MQSRRRLRIGWSTIALSLLTAAVVAVAVLNWRERANRRYDVNDGLAQLVRSTSFIDSRGELHCGSLPIPHGLTLGYKGVHSSRNRYRPRLCEITTACLRRASWDSSLDSDQRAKSFAWLAERKTLSGVRISYPEVTADNLAQLALLPHFTALRLDYVPRTDAVWIAVGGLGRLDELVIGLPVTPEPILDSGHGDWPADDAAEDAQTQAEIDAAARADASSIEDSETTEQPARFGRRQLELMSGLPNVRHLVLGQLTIDDDALPRLKSLEVLKLSGCKIGRDAYSGLARCPHVKELEIEALSPGEFGAACVAKMPQLRALTFDGPITDDELEALCASRTLTSLELTDVSRLGPPKLALLAAVPIERLKIRLGAQDPAERLLAALQQVSTLRHLTLDVVMMSPAHLRALTRLEQLENLEIETLRLTPHQIDVVARAVPRTTLRVRSTKLDELVVVPPAKKPGPPNSE